MEDNDLIAEAILDLSKSVRLLGSGNVARDDLAPGAIEGLAMLIRESNERIAASLDGIAEAMDRIADAIQSMGDET